MNDYNAECKKIEDEKAAFAEAEAARQSQVETEGQEFVPEVREWTEPELPPISTELRKFVVSIDLLGQDRDFTDAQKS